LDDGEVCEPHRRDPTDVAVLRARAQDLLRALDANDESAVHGLLVELADVVITVESLAESKIGVSLTKVKKAAGAFRNADVKLLATNVLSKWKAVVSRSNAS